MHRSAAHGRQDAGMMVTVSEKPGFGFNIDDSKVDTETLIEF